MTKFLVKKRKILDESQVSWLEILQHSLVNFLFGFTSGIVIAFVTLYLMNTNLKYGSLLFVIYFIHKQIESKVLNRNKYVTKLGRNYIFPIPSTIGFLLGAYLSTFI